MSRHVLLDGVEARVKENHYLPGSKSLLETSRNLLIYVHHIGLLPEIRVLVDIRGKRVIL